MTTKIKLYMNPVSQIIRDKGLDAGGDVQKQLTMEADRRIGRYMPHLTGVLETKLKHVIKLRWKDRMRAISIMALRWLARRRSILPVARSIIPKPLTPKPGRFGIAV